MFYTHSGEQLGATGVSSVGRGGVDCWPQRPRQAASQRNFLRRNGCDDSGRCCSCCSRGLSGILMHPDACVIYESLPSACAIRTSIRPMPSSPSLVPAPSTSPFSVRPAMLSVGDPRSVPVVWLLLYSERLLRWFRCFRLMRCGVGFVMSLALAVGPFRRRSQSVFFVSFSLPCSCATKTVSTRRSGNGMSSHCLSVLFWDICCVSCSQEVTVKMPNRSTCGSTHAE